MRFCIWLVSEPVTCMIAYCQHIAFFLVLFTDTARCTQYTLIPTVVPDSDTVVGSVSPSGATLLTSENITQVQLYCGLSGIPPPSVTWLGPNGSPLMLGLRYSVMETDSFSMLTISNYNVDVDAGQYSCLAGNIGGQQTCSVTLGPCNCVIGEWSEVSSYPVKRL